MKRSEMVELISNITLNDLTHFSLTKEEAELLLFHIEKAGMRLVDEEYGVTGWEPEEGWEAWIEEQDRAAEAIDFELPIDVASKKIRDVAMVDAFLAGCSFDAIAQDFNVTGERVRQIVAKYRRKYKQVK